MQMYLDMSLWSNSLDHSIYDINCLSMSQGDYNTKCTKSVLFLYGTDQTMQKWHIRIKMHCNLDGIYRYV